MEEIHAEAVEIMDKINLQDVHCDSAREIMDVIWELWMWFDHYHPNGIYSQTDPDIVLARIKLAELREYYETKEEF
jgi:hypothetical protein